MKSIYRSNYGLFVIRPHKYGNHKTEFMGRTFDSRLEANRYAELLMLQKAGEIMDLQCQPVFELLPSFKKNGKTYRAITYRADFMYTEVKGKKIVVEDAKGFKTQEYMLKKKLFEYIYPDMTIKEITK